MDCPHCGTENLVGATLCASCGKGMFSVPSFGPASPQPAAEDTDLVPAQMRRAPAATTTVRRAADELAAAAPPPKTWGAGPAVPAPAPQPEGPLQALCRICRSPFEYPAEAKGDATTTCSSCRTLARDVAQMAPSEVQIHPAVSDKASEGAAAAQPRGAGELRPRPVLAKKAGVRKGPVAAIVGLVLVLVGFAVVAIARREPDHASELLGDVRAQESRIELAPADGFVGRVWTTVRLDVLREDARAFGGTSSKGLDFRQTTVQECEVALVRNEDEGLVLDVQSAGRVADQQGRAGSEDAREASLYPWQGPRGTVRVRLAPRGPLRQLDDAHVTPGLDVPPLSHAGALGATSLTFRTGDRWKADLVLPVLVDRQGRLFACSFPAEVAYAGRAVRGGYACAAFRVTAQVPRQLPAPVDDEFNRTSGKVAGAVWVELATGLVAGADLVVDARLWKDVGKVEQDLRVTGRLTIERK